MAIETIRSSVSSDLVPDVEYALIAPDGFREMKDLPLVLNLHGGGGNRERLLDQAPMWQQLWESGAIPPAIVVMPSVTERGFYMNFHDGSERWEDFLTGPFLEYLRNTYPATGDAKRTFLTGASMGGMGSLRMAFRHPDLFGAVAALEPGIEPILRFEDMEPKHRFWRSDALLQQAYGNPVDTEFWANNNPASMAVKSADRIRDSGLQIYLEAGDMDQFWLHEGAEFLHQVLWNQRIRHEYHLVRGGDHVGPSMGERMDEAVRFLFRYHSPWQETPRMKMIDRMLDPLKARIDGRDHFNEAPELPAHYAESVMIALLSEDGQLDLSLRLARFPLRGDAEVWLHFVQNSAQNSAEGDDAWSTVDDSLAVNLNEATPVDNAVATFAATHPTQSLAFSSTQRGDQLRGHVEGILLVTRTRHAEKGTGTIPMEVSLDFVAQLGGFRSPNGRWELTGELRGEIRLEGKTIEIDQPGKWHEQTGPRAQFAPAFTYFNIQNESTSILVIAGRKRVGGYVESSGNVVPVTAFMIESEGPNDRKFSIELENGNVIEGMANVVQRWSVPIEGKRRPGSSVLVESNRGVFYGSLNDWEPPEPE